MSENASLLGRVARHRSMSFARNVVRHGLDATAHRLSLRLQFPPVPPVGDTQAASQAAELSRHILGQQTVLTHHSLDRLDRSLLLQGRIAGMQMAELRHIRHLGDVEFRVSSQWGEDGIIEWLCRLLPNLPRSFVEFGVENFGEANCRFLLQNRGWRGLVLDGSEQYMMDLRQEPLYWRYDLTSAAAFVTAENINALISDNGFGGPIGILSVDIDGNDYWVLEAIDCVDPAIIICEVNGVLGDLKACTIPYRADFARMDAHYSGQYFGCSVAAVRRLCSQRGYSFIGTNTNGVNAFFVRNDLADRVLACIEEVRAWAPRHRDSRDMQGRLDFVRGVARYELIADMPVVDLETGRLVALRELQPLYSEQFLEDFR